MKNIFTILFSLVVLASYSQKYLELIPEIAPDSAGCGGKIKAVFHGGILPLENTFEYYTTQISGGGMVIENLCDNTNNTVSFIDSVCSDLESQLKLHADTSEQITLDTILITMPSGPGMCDAQVELRFRNVKPTDTPSYGTGVVNGNITSYFLNNFCGNIWSFSISRNAIEEIKVSMDIRVTLPSPCFPFDEGITVSTPSTSTFCNGQIASNPIGGSGQPYYYSFYSSAGNLMNGNPAQNQVGSICQGPYQVDISQDGNIMRKRTLLFIWADDAGYLTWNEPDSLLPFTDTVEIQALANCSADYSVGIDTAYISSITANGIGNYDFEISLVQGLDTIVSIGSAIIDTSTNFFLDMTIYCGDSTRSNEYAGKRNLIYHGIKLQSTASASNHDYFSSIEIFPNPFKDRISVNYSLKQSSLLKFELSDITGKIIYTENIYSVSGKNQQNLSFSNLNSGMYFLNVFNESKLIYSGKIIRQ